MQYQLTGIESHLDYGFGITGEAYYDSAEMLFSKLDKLKSFQQANLPCSFLYRHSIELFLKSLIIIFHKRLKLAYDNEPYNTTNPKALINKTWQGLFQCHWIDELYNYWFKELYSKNLTKIKKAAPKGDWRIDYSILEDIIIVSKYDRDSSYFRYPITKNNILDSQKYTMQNLDLNQNIDLTNDNQKQDSKRKGRLFMLLKNEYNEIVEGYEKLINQLDHVINALKKVSHYFYCMHIMTRITLCNGN